MHLFSDVATHKHYPFFENVSFKARYSNVNLQQIRQMVKDGRIASTEALNKCKIYQIDWLTVKGLIQMCLEVSWVGSKVEAKYATELLAWIDARISLMRNGQFYHSQL